MLRVFMRTKAQTFFDLLYNLLYSKSTTNRTNGVWALSTTRRAVSFLLLRNSFALQKKLPHRNEAIAWSDLASFAIIHDVTVILLFFSALISACFEKLRREC